MKDSRQLRCIGPIRVNFLFLPIIIVVIFFFMVFFSDSLTEFILAGYSFFAGGRGGGGGGGGGMIKSVVRLLMESYAVNMQHSTETSTAVLSRAHKR